MSPLRTSVKSAIESALVVSGGADVYRRRRSEQLLVLAYHDIVPTGAELAGDRSLHLPQVAFAEQLDALTRTHRVIPLRDALSPSTTHDQRDSRPCVAITFDDAYAGAVTVGVEELRSRALPATIFVTPSFLDGKTFWWDVLATATSGLEDSLRERALTEARGLTDAVLALAHHSGLSTREMPAHARGASTAQLKAAMEFDGITLAAHTWNHPNLTALADADLMTELVRPMEWLKQFGDRALPMISYPYGLADRRVMDASHDAGYTAGFMIDGGWTTHDPRDPLAIPRLNVPAGVSRDGFILRAAGLIQG
ncbi:MAG: polysaccharide deacetylase family protein [Gemmatimonadaceae bacterium]